MEDVDQLTSLKVYTLESFLCKKLLCINFNYKLRLAPYMTSSEKHILMNAFFKSRFNCCPHELNRLHERCLHIVYKNKKLHFGSLLERHGSASTHHQVIRFLAIEMFKLF